MLVSSVSGLVSSIDSAAYDMSKAALIGLAVNYARDFASADLKRRPPSEMREASFLSDRA